MNKSGERQRGGDRASANGPLGDVTPRLSQRRVCDETPQLGAERGRDDVLDAAGELLVSRGLVALTLDAVAQRAHVDRTLLSRWWPSEEALAMDVLHHEWVALAAHVYRGAFRFGLVGERG
jgi:AcrR family transcriptional regulator